MLICENKLTSIIQTSFLFNNNGLRQFAPLKKVTSNNIFSLSLFFCKKNLAIRYHIHQNNLYNCHA